MIELTQEEQIAKHYAACIDSVNLIDGDKPEQTTDEEWADTVARTKSTSGSCWLKIFGQPKT